MSWKKTNFALGNSHKIVSQDTFNGRRINDHLATLCLTSFNRGFASPHEFKALFLFVERLR